MFAQDDERDENHDDEEEDAALDDENSDEEEDEDDADKDEDEDSDDADDDEKSEEDDEKPVSRKEFNAALKKLGNRSNASRRVNTSKDRDGKDRKDKSNDRRPNSQSPDTNKRLSEVEKSIRKGEVLEKKRDFGYQHNLSPKQVDHVFKLTNRPTKKFLEDPVVKAALDAISTQSNVRDNTPSSGGRGFKSQGGKSWEKMNDDEKKENFVDRRRAILNSKKGR